MGNANYTSNFLILPIIGLSWLVFLRGKWLWSFPLVLCVLALNVTRGRASILGILIGVIVLLALSGSRKALIGGVVGCLLVGTLFLGTGNRAQLLNDHSLNERFKYWRAAYEVWKENPVFGCGVWSFRSEVYEAQAKQGEGYFADYEMPKPRRVHNDWLETLCESGVVGFGLVGSLVLSVGIHAWRLRRECPMLFAGYVGVLAGAFFMFPTRLSANFAYLCVFFGVIEAEYEKRSFGMVSGKAV
jgi:O-antigen ligase